MTATVPPSRRTLSMACGDPPVQQLPVGQPRERVVKRPALHVLHLLGVSVGPARGRPRGAGEMET